MQSWKREANASPTTLKRESASRSLFIVHLKPYSEKQKLEEEVQVTKQTIENIIDKKATDKKDKIPDSKSKSSLLYLICHV